MFEGNDSAAHIRTYTCSYSYVPPRARWLNYTCCVVGCTKRGERGIGIHFYTIPAVIQNETRELSLRRRQA